MRLDSPLCATPRGALLISHGCDRLDGGLGDARLGRTAAVSADAQLASASAAELRKSGGRAAAGPPARRLPPLTRPVTGGSPYSPDRHRHRGVSARGGAAVSFPRRARSRIACGELHRWIAQRVACGRHHAADVILRVGGAEHRVQRRHGGEVDAAGKQRVREAVEPVQVNVCGRRRIRSRGAEERADLPRARRRVVDRPNCTPAARAAHVENDVQRRRVHERYVPADRGRFA
jgi:hypothetical protein